MIRLQPSSLLSPNTTLHLGYGVQFCIFNLSVSNHGRLVQGKGLYVSDPLALHHILVKEQDVYEEPRWFTSLVLLQGSMLTYLTPVILDGIIWLLGQAYWLR